MKRSLALSAILCLLASAGRADYVNPPGWDDNPYFTHQSWDFVTSDNPLAPDGGQYVSPGEPLLTVSGGTHGEYLQNNGWFFNGPLNQDSGPHVEIFVPNIPNPNMVKEIWFQASIYVNFPLDVQNDVDFYVVANGEEYTTDQFSVVPGQDAGHAIVTAWLTVSPQPPDEIINIALGIGNQDQFVFLDQIDVDTRCVPEPTMFALWSLVGVAGVGFYWRKRRNR